MSGPGVWGTQLSCVLAPGGATGQILHGSATTTHAIRAAIQRSKAPLKELAATYGFNRKTVAKVEEAELPPRWADGTEGASLDGDERRGGGGGGRLPQAHAAAAGRRSRTSPAQPCTAASSGTASAGCPRPWAIRLPRRRSSATRWAISTSTSPKSAPRRASCTSSWPWTGRRSTPSLDWSSETQAWPSGRSWKSSSQPLR